MKYVKLLIVASAVAAMALLVAGTASATVLCRVEGTGSPTGTTCPAGQAYSTGTEIHAVSAAKYITTTSFKNFECEENTFTTKTTNEGSATETVNMQIEILTSNGCNCETKTLAKGKMEIHWIEGTNNGTVTWTGEERTISCNTLFGTVHCIYTTNATDIGTLTGGNPATLDIEGAGIPTLTTSSLCDKEAKWDAKYRITTPASLFVVGHT